MKIRPLLYSKNKNLFFNRLITTAHIQIFTLGLLRSGCVALICFAVFTCSFLSHPFAYANGTAATLPLLPYRCYLTAATLRRFFAVLIMLFRSVGAASLLISLVTPGDRRARTGQFFKKIENASGRFN
ncbi:hypothetical protein [Methanimicrococcus blatticola]|uniref:hypothetical protein n=1 Tax=Methanimicrococcus blatticola TaxID=91560 RepID=UPI00105B36CD|nr:hypothetical protein [Methanimicrococcus blatticola]MBZ3935785.1 hypothetical protein [Methanimicrococcus blatticola]MCC2508095.1 hypothetical protein [Methanimicrococcus blatticola]